MFIVLEQWGPFQGKWDILPSTLGLAHRQFELHFLLQMLWIKMCLHDTQYIYIQNFIMITFD